MLDATQDTSEVETLGTETPIKEVETEKVNSEETEDKKTTEKSEVKKDATDESEEQVIRFHGKDFTDINEVVKEANAVLGRNAKLAGDLDDTIEKMEKMEEQMKEAIEANKKWQEYYSKDEQPDLTGDKLEKALEKIEAKKAEVEKAKQRETEFEELQTEADFPEVLSEMRLVQREKGDDWVNKMTPKELYNYAKHRLGLDAPVDRKKIKEEADKKAIHQQKAKSQLGGGGGNSAGSGDDLSPEVADYLKQIM